MADIPPTPKEYIFFYNYYDKETGYLSNFSIHSFKDDRLFDTIERYMHYKKAMLFNDIHIAEQIMSSSTAYQTKMLGRKVKNFNQKIWDLNKKNIVKTGIQFKFKQNFAISQQLLATGNKYLVEAAKNDKIWGIGYSSSDALTNINSWGQNLLGEILMEIRAEINS